MEENKNIAHIGLGPENVTFKHTLTYNPETHVVVPVVKWRRFSEDNMPDNGDMIWISRYTVPQEQPFPTQWDKHNNWSPSWHWCYQSELDLSEWLPK